MARGSCTTRLSAWAGRSRSPTRRRSRDLRRWLARPTGSTPGFWLSSPAAIWCLRSGCLALSSAPNGSERAGGCTWSANALRSSTGSTPSCWRSGTPARFDLFGRQGRELLAGLDFPDPWRDGVLAAVGMIDDLNRQITAIDRELKQLGADHPYIPTLMTAPGIAWVLGYTIAAEIGDIHRFSSPNKLTATPACARASTVRQYRPPRTADARRTEVPALGADRSRKHRSPTPRLPGALSAQQAPARSTARRQGRPRRHRPPPGRGDLAHAHPSSTLRSGRRHFCSGRIDGPF